MRDLLSYRMMGSSKAFLEFSRIALLISYSKHINIVLAKNTVNAMAQRFAGQYSKGGPRRTLA